MSNNHDLTFKDRGHPLMVLAASTSAPVVKTFYNLLFNMVMNNF